MPSYSYYNRYNTLNNDSQSLSAPRIKLSEKSTDEMIVYNVNKTRLDKVSLQYYNSPYFGFLILMANPQYGGLEWNIQDGQVIRIPYPLKETLDEYILKLSQRLAYYGY